MDDVEIYFDGTVPKGTIIIEGFQGVGLVGTLAAQYIADKMKAKVVGYVTSHLLPPMALLINGEIRPPIRIYKFKKGANTFLIFESELPIPQKLITKIAKKIAEFAKKNKVKEIISLEGLAVPKTPIPENTYFISNSEKKFNNLKKHSKLLANGIVIGVSAALLLEAKMQKIPAACIMAEAHADYPDGLAASSIIKLLSKVYGLKIDTAPLEKESKKFEQKVLSIIEKAQQIKESVESPRKTYIG